MWCVVRSRQHGYLQRYSDAEGYFLAREFKTYSSTLFETIVSAREQALSGFLASE
mgnify:FL=1